MSFSVHILLQDGTYRPRQFAKPDFDLILVEMTVADPKALAGFDQDNFVQESNLSDHTLADLSEEFDMWRRAKIIAFSHLGAEMLHQAPDWLWTRLEKMLAEEG